MDAGTRSIKVIFGQDRRHIVPLYQRPYVWKRDDQWVPLWEDIRAVAERVLADLPPRSHFLGAIVLDQVRNSTGHLESRLVIDGQQRLTTIQIFLEAFCDYCKTIGADRHHRALLKLTRNDDPMSEDADDVFKVWPTTLDQEHFRRVMNAESPAELKAAYGVKIDKIVVGHAIGDAYLYFHQEISTWLAASGNTIEARIEALYTSVREHVRMVVIDLAADDDAQVIFETLNARGTPLLPSDLIKNFLFHRAKTDGANNNKLYVAFWKPFDEEAHYWRAEMGRGHARRARLDIFLTHYLTLKLGDEVPVGRLYTLFRDYVSQSGICAADHLADVQRYAAVYRSFDNTPPGTREALFFERLRTMDIFTAYPFVMELFLRHAQTPEVLVPILVDFESFLVRRMICGMNTRGYGRFFADLAGDLAGADGDPHGAVRDALTRSSADSSRWPSDDDLEAAFVEAPIYEQLVQPRVRMILEALERQLRTGKTERLTFDEKLTIEHLLPQGWTTLEWPLPTDVAEDKATARRNRVLHSLGNLTLLTEKLNPAISNGAWDAKIKEINNHSLLKLNKALSAITVWNEDSIASRASDLALLAREVWPGPPPSPAPSANAAGTLRQAVVAVGEIADE